MVSLTTSANMFFWVAAMLGATTCYPRCLNTLSRLGPGQPDMGWLCAASCMLLFTMEHRADFSASHFWLQSGKILILWWGEKQSNCEWFFGFLWNMTIRLAPAMSARLVGLICSPISKTTLRLSWFWDLAYLAVKACFTQYSLSMIEKIYPDRGAVA